VVVTRPSACVKILAKPPFLGLGIDIADREGQPLPAFEANHDIAFILVGIDFPWGLRRPMAMMGKTGDLRDVGVDELKGVFEEVNAPIIEDAAGNLAARPPPIARLGVAAHVTLDADDAADHFVFLDLAHGLEDSAIPMAVVVGREHDARFFCGGDHGIDFGGGDGEGLFADDMPPGLETLQGEWRMGVVRRDEDDQVHVRFLQHFLGGGIGLDSGEVDIGGLEPG